MTTSEEQDALSDKPISAGLPPHNARRAEGVLDLRPVAGKTTGAIAPLARCAVQAVLVTGNSQQRRHIDNNDGE